MSDVVVREYISKYRNDLMAFAIISIMIGHLRHWGLMDFGDFAFLASLGSVGVEIFLFVSGFGLFCGFTHNNSLLRYFKRRFLRIIPTYIVIMVSIDVITRNFSYIINPRIWYMHFLSNWFIPFILIMYVVFPILYILQKRWIYLPFIISCILTVVLTIFLQINGEGDIQDVPMLMAQRIPIFVLGMLIADNRVKFNFKHVKLIVLIILISLYVIVWLFGVEYLKYILFLPFSFFLVLYITNILDKYFRDNSSIRHNIISSHTLEIYLIHMFLMPKMLKYNFDPYLTLIIVFGGSILYAIIIKKIVDFIEKIIYNSNNDPHHIRGN